MFIYIDESGDLVANAQSAKIFVLGLLVIRDRASLLRVRSVVRWSTRRFQDRLRTEGRLRLSDTLTYVKGSGIKLKGGRKLPGIGSYPDLCTGLFERLARQAPNVRLYIICYDKSLNQFAGRQWGSGAVGYMRRYTRVLSNLVPSIATSPLPRRLKRYKWNNRTFSDLTTVVCDRFTGDQDGNLRRQFAHRLLATIKQQRRFRKRARIQIWHNETENDECLQMIDIITNYFYQSQALGFFQTAGPRHVIGQPRAAAHWTPEQWRDAYTALSPIVGQSQFSRWLRRMPGRWP